MDEIAARALARLQTIAATLPEVTERPSHGMPSFFVRDAKMFANLADRRHGSPHVALWLAAPPGLQESLCAGEAARFFRPPYVGTRGWIGVVLNGRAPWTRIDALFRDAFAFTDARR